MRVDGVSAYAEMFGDRLGVHKFGRGAVGRAEAYGHAVSQLVELLVGQGDE
jgi:hypothetical protein